MSAQPEETIQRRIRRRRTCRVVATKLMFVVVLVLALAGMNGNRFGKPGQFVAFCDAKTVGTETTETDEDGNEIAKVDSRLKLNQILIKAGKRGLGGGIPGALAGVVQVLSLMWLRTIINYQSRYGATFLQAFSNLWNDGGIPRFYRGLVFALVQAPLSRFVSTAANDGVEALLASLKATKDWGPGRTTIVASVVVGLWRMMLMPIDTCKTVLQVDSVEGFKSLMRRVRAGRVGVLYQGAFANALSAFVGHYPWFFTYNLLSKSQSMMKFVRSQLLRNALIGIAASVVSDTTVNSIRVVKTTKQAMGSKNSLGYIETIRTVLAVDGWRGLFGRGLRTRIGANALQSIIFTIIWRGLAERWQKQGNEQTDSTETSTK